jgi:hypothetical protein
VSCPECGSHWGWIRHYQDTAQNDLCENAFHFPTKKTRLAASFLKAGDGAVFRKEPDGFYTMWVQPGNWDDRFPAMWTYDHVAGDWPHGPWPCWDPED